VTEADFDFLRDFLRRRSGLSLGPEKRYLAESRLAPLARAAGLTGISDVVAALRLGGNETFARSVVDAMATHETLFFRDRAPFDTLRDSFLPAFAAQRPEGRPLRVWSAAASTGQEAYSVAMLVREIGATLKGRSVEIVATDISESAIARARRGVYSAFEVQRGLPIRKLLEHFTQVEAGWQISAALRAMVDFQVFNLLDDFTSLGRFDVVLCRNLLIYLDRPTKEALLARLAGALMPDGVLCLGGPESALGLCGALIPHPAAQGFFLRAGAIGHAATLPHLPAHGAAERAGARPAPGR
jgi:chemotaxis protein methyltransferase CheR